MSELSNVAIFFYSVGGCLSFVLILIARDGDKRRKHAFKR